MLFLHDVFLAHNSQEKPWLRKIYDELIARGKRVFFDEESIRHEEPIAEQLAFAIRHSALILVYFGPSGQGRFHKLEAALVRRLRQRQRSAELIVGLAEGANIEDTPAYFQSFPELNFGPLYFEDGISRVIQAVERIKAKPQGDDARPAARGANNDFLDAVAA
ncbi:MAG: toll/interleukin-1 receptor domain-containing protein, partial [Pseudomonadota bacterium]